MTDFEQPDDLAVTVEGRNGVLKRWGPDEVDGADVPLGLSFTTAIPNGFDTLTSSLLRRIDLDYPDLQLLGDVNVYGPGQEPVWQGRHTQFPREHGDDFNITPSAVGWAAHLLDDPSFSEVYVDVDATRWGDTPLNRQITVQSVSISMGDFSWSTDQGGLMCALPNQQLGTQTDAEIWYIAPAGVLIAKVMFIGADHSLPAGWEGPTVRTFTSDAGAGEVGYSLTFDGTLRSQAITPQRYVVFREYSNGAVAVTPAAGANRSIKTIGAYGDHGLTTQAIDSSTPDGIYLSDIVEDVVSRAAPLLDTSDIDTNTIVIPHCVFEQSTASDALLSLNNYAQWDWGVYENRRFFFRAPDPDRLTWIVRLSEGTGLGLEGEQADDVYNGVIVKFTDALTGQTKVYGPTGAAFADFTDDSLADTSADNPANQAGIPRKWGVLDMGSTVTTQAGALTIGQAWLGEKSLPQRRGTVTVKGWAHHPTAGLRPAWAIRAGDFVRIEDHPADVPRKIIATSYDHQSRTNTLTVGNTSHKIDAILELFGARLVGLGSG